jgi:hypothetical protein
MRSDTTRLQLEKPLSTGEIVKTLGAIDARRGIPGADKLDPLEELSSYFPNDPVRKKVHLVVRLPYTGGHQPYTLSCIARVAYRSLRSYQRD